MDPVAAAVLSSWTFDGSTLLLVFTIGALYLRGWLRLHEERPHKYTAGRLCSFASGLVAILIALESPIDAFGSLLLQAHMIQHLLLLAVAPPLLLQGQPVLPLLRGLPRWLFKDTLGPFLSSHTLKQAGGAIVHPVVTWSAMSVAMVAWHVPHLYDLALREPAWHQFEHACFFWSAILFWWPVVGVWPARSAWPRWAMIPYLLFAGMVNMGVSAVLSFAGHPLYVAYATAPRIWGISAHEDQAAAGGIMWVLGSLAMLIPAAAIGMQALETPRVTRRVPVPLPLPPILRAQSKRRRDFLGALLRFRHFRPALQAAMLALAVVVAAHGFSGPQVASVNLAGVLPWTYWRALAVIALLLAGNLFCMACPFTLPRDLARRFVKPRFSWPVWLRSKWLAIGLLAVYLWAVEAFSLWDSPLATAWIIVGYFTAAFAVDTLFKGASFCKYVCPIGQFHFVQSLVSPMQIKVREPQICESCRTYDCIRGNARTRGCELQLFQPRKLGNFDCTFCLDCVHACPSGNVGVQRVSPAATLLETRPGSGIGRLTRRLDVAALILILVFGAFLNAAAMTSAAMMWLHRWHARLGLTSMVPLVTGLSIAGLLVVPVGLAITCAWLSRAAVQTSWKELIGGFSIALVPIGFSMWLAHFSKHLAAAWSAFIPTGWVPSLQLCFLDAGLLLTLYVAWRVAGRFAASAGATLAAALPWALLAASLYAAGVWIVFQPMQMSGMTT